MRICTHMLADQILRQAHHAAALHKEEVMQLCKGAHQSTEGPWPVPLMISGARYSSVPTKELARPSGSAISVSCSASAAARLSALLPCCFCETKREVMHEALVGAVVAMGQGSVGVSWARRQKGPQTSNLKPSAP